MKTFTVFFENDPLRPMSTTGHRPFGVSGPSAVFALEVCAADYFIRMAEQWFPGWQETDSDLPEKLHAEYRGVVSVYEGDYETLQAAQEKEVPIIVGILTEIGLASRSGAE